MQPYQTYFPPMNNGYSQQMPMQNPYQQRMDFLQSYQQSLQPPAQTNQQMNVIGKIVDSVEMVKSMDIPMDGNLYYFPKADGTEIFGKQWLSNGQTHIITFMPNSESGNQSDRDEKSNSESFKGLAEVFEKRFDSLEGRINEVLSQNQSKNRTKTVQSSTKKESDS